MRIAIFLDAHTALESHVGAYHQGKDKDGLAFVLVDAIIAFLKRMCSIGHTSVSYEVAVYRFQDDVQNFICIIPWVRDDVLRKQTWSVEEMEAKCGTKRFSYATMTKPMGTERIPHVYDDMERLIANVISQIAHVLQRERAANLTTQMDDASVAAPVVWRTIFITGRDVTVQNEATGGVFELKHRAGYNSALNDAITKLDAPLVCLVMRNMSDYVAMRWNEKIAMDRSRAIQPERDGEEEVLMHARDTNELDCPTKDDVSFCDDYFSLLSNVCSFTNGFCYRLLGANVRMAMRASALCVLDLLEVDPNPKRNQERWSFGIDCNASVAKKVGIESCEEGVAEEWQMKQYTSAGNAGVTFSFCDLEAPVQDWNVFDPSCLVEAEVLLTAAESVKKPVAAHTEDVGILTSNIQSLNDVAHSSKLGSHYDPTVES